MPHDSLNPLTIRAVRPRSVNAPIGRPIRTASGALESAPLVLVDVETDQGITGRAYAMGYTPLTLAPLRILLEGIAPLIQGMAVAPAEISRMLEDKFRLLGGQGLVGMAVSTLDQALWDALGKAAGLPVARLLGGASKPLPAYDSHGLVDPVSDRELIERSLERGFRAIKVKLGDGPVARDAETMRALRDMVGPDVILMVDYNQSKTVSETLRRIDAIEPYDIYWVEEPVPAEDWESHARVRERSPIPIQTGENWWRPIDMAKAIAAGACDYAMPDLQKIGGITGWMSAMGAAAAASVPVSSHLFQEASAHVLPATPTMHWLEYLDIAEAVLTESLPVVGGCVTPRGPGLGMEWDEAAVAKYAV